MQIIKPMRLGVLTKPFSHMGRHWLAVTAMAYFDFDEPDRLLPDTKMWPEVMGVLGGDALLDLGMPKPHAELLVGGSAHPPGGAPATVAEVGVRLGPVDKRLLVFGDRFWSPRPGTQRAGATAPQPFTAMPITWANAYGGPGFARNPLGKGHAAIDGVQRGEAPVPLPNVEDPARLVGGPRDEAEPAGLGPLDIGWPQRQSLAGTYDKEWLRRDFPGLAADIDWRIFNAAPQDQRLAGYLEPDTPFAVSGMHPDRPVQRGRVPGIRVRAFVQRQEADGTLRLVEGGTRIDTLWLFPGLNRGVTLHRAGIEIADGDGFDVKAVMLAWERAADPPRPFDHYREVLDLRLDPEEGGLYALSDGQLSPPKTPEEIAAREAERQAVIDMMVARSEAMRRKALESAKLPPDRTVELPPIDRGMFGPVVTPGQIEEFDVDLKALIDHARAAGAELQKKSDEAIADARKKQAEAEALGQSLGFVPESLEDRKRKARESAAWQPKALRPPGREEADGPSDFLRLVKVDIDPELLAQAEPVEMPDLAAREEEVMDALARLRRHMMGAMHPQPPWSDEVGDDLADHVRALLAGGATLAGRDLAGARLAGMDFSGADLRAVMLEKADLRGCRFDGARLDGAVFTEAILDGASFAGAAMAGCNLSAASAVRTGFAGATLSKATLFRSRLAGADLSRCALDGVIAVEADLTGADLSGSTLSMAAWVLPRMAGARMQGASIELAALVKADLTGADLSHARLERAGLPDLTAPGLSLHRARIRNISTSSKADLTGADLSWSDADQTSWFKCALQGANLTGARLDGAIFTLADLRGATLAGASLRGAHFTAADVRRGDLTAIDGRDAIFRKTLLSDSALAGANLYAAMLDEANLEGTRLTGANLGLTLFTRREKW